MLKQMLDRMREAHAAEAEGEEAAESGFTLIELMVVLLIIAILLAIAIPTFLGVTNSANDRAAQSNLTNAITEASATYQNQGQSYTNIVSQEGSSAPEFVWVSGTTSLTATACSPKGQTNCISAESLDVATTGDQAGVLMAAYSPNTQHCWFVLKLEATPASGVFTTSSGGTGDSSAGTYYALKKSDTTCSASQATGASFIWEPSFAAATNNAN